jgi:hypothetical protein
MKKNRMVNPKNFMVRRVLRKRGGVHSCPNAEMSGGKAAGGIGASQR